MGDDPELISREAQGIAEQYWGARDDFHFVGPTSTFGEALDRALADGAARPYVISDSGDNPTAGRGDVSWSLGELLARDDLRDPGRLVILASIFDAAAVAEAVSAGCRLHGHAGGGRQGRPGASRPGPDDR